jgi:hypothetical protein
MNPAHEFVKYHEKGNPVFSNDFQFKRKCTTKTEGGLTSHGKASSSPAADLRNRLTAR